MCFEIGNTCFQVGGEIVLLALAVLAFALGFMALGGKGGNKK